MSKKKYKTFSEYMNEAMVSGETINLPGGLKRGWAFGSGGKLKKREKKTKKENKNNTK